MADSMEMTILSILSPALHCEWHITRYQQALATTVGCVLLHLYKPVNYINNIHYYISETRFTTHCQVWFDMMFSEICLPTVTWRLVMIYAYVLP